MRMFPRSFVLLVSLAVTVSACGDDGSVLVESTGVTTEETSQTSELLPETTEAAPETTEAAPETTEVPPETTEAAPETTEAAPETTEPPPPQVPVLTPFDASESHDAPAIEMDVTIPIVSAVPAAAADLMNSLISLQMLAIPSSFRDELAASPPPDQPGVSSELVLIYTPRAVLVELLSIRFDVYTYYQGAAHCMSDVFTVNFDPQTGSTLLLVDILVPGTFPAVAILVEQRLIDDLYGGDATEAAAWLPVIDDIVLRNWAVAPDGLEFSFSQYEVGFGAMGAPTVVIPWADLVAVISLDGPAGSTAFGA